MRINRKLLKTAQEHNYPPYAPVFKIASPVKSLDSCSIVIPYSISKIDSFKDCLYYLNQCKNILFYDAI